MGWVIRAATAAGFAVGASLALSQTAAAATFTCAVSASVNDAGPSSTLVGGSPCVNPQQAPSADGDSVRGFALAQAGQVSSFSSVDVDTSVFAGVSTLAVAFDRVSVAGLPDAGADFTFDLQVLGGVRGETPGPSRFTSPTATSSMAASVFLATSSGASASSRFSACGVSATRGISVCNGVFDIGPTEFDVFNAFLQPTIHLRNGDILDITLQLQTSALGHTPDSSDFAKAFTNDSLSWRGVFAGAPGVALIGTTGFNYGLAPPTTGGVPEPASWALMIAGFGLAGGVLRRRRAACA